MTNENYTLDDGTEIRTGDEIELTVDVDGETDTLELEVLGVSESVNVGMPGGDKIGFIQPNQMGDVDKYSYVLVATHPGLSNADITKIQVV